MLTPFFGCGTFSRFCLILCLGDDRVHLLFRHTSHFHHGVGLNDRQVVVRQIALLDKLLRQIFGHAIQFCEAGDSSFDLVFEFVCCHDFDVPPAEFARESHILTSPTDCQRKLIFSHQHDGATNHVAQQHLFDFGGLEGVWNQDFGIVTPTDDVDPLAGQFIHDVLDPIATHANTRTDAINSLIRTAHSNLAAIAWFTCQLVDGNHAIGDFRNLLLEQPSNQIGVFPTEHDLDAIALRFDLVNDRPHAFVGMMRFALNLFAAGQYRLDARQRHGRGSAITSLHNSGNHRADLLFVLFDQRVAFRLTNLLNDHLLGCLCADPPDHLGVEFHAIADASESARLAVDRDRDIRLFAVLLTSCRSQRRFDRLEDDFRVNVLITMQRIDDS